MLQFIHPKSASVLITVFYILQSKSSFAKETPNCTINGVRNNYLEITDSVYDTDIRKTIPFTYLLDTQGVKSVSTNEPNVEVYINHNNNLFVIVSKINEPDIISRESKYDLKFELILYCVNHEQVSIITKIPVVDTNNHNPFFSKPTYVYNLISFYMEDFKRQHFLHPITATDFDITNNELQFSVQENPYFELITSGPVPGTLNKRHLVQIVPKFSIAKITKKLELLITVTDVGYPSRKNVSKLVINPPSPPVPIFTKPYYVAHFYKNQSLMMPEIPELLEGVTYYDTQISESCTYLSFSSQISDEKLYVGETAEFYNNNYYKFYEINYDICTLQVKYNDRLTQLSSVGTVPLFVAFHHDL